MRITPILNRYVLAGAVACALPIAIASADRPAPHKPPQAAFDACANAKQGDACTVTHGDHTLTGTCQTFPDTTQLVCHPDHPHGPPPEAIAACSSAKAGDACTVTHGDHTIAGTCANGPDGNGPLACHPNDPPPHR
ncbi:MAG: hypothetical protein HOV81_33920 [Kofleriaceae bacterium]|nr:hypothetical protein [Kofleriaceae bacterium]